MRFVFLDPGPLIDNELQLVAPESRWFDEVLASAAHPLTVRDAPQDAQTTRQKLSDFLAAAPGGRQPGDPSSNRLPAYHFWMRLAEPIGEAPPVRMAGGMGLRIGINREIEFYSGNIGYHVYPPARGHRYAERACRLVLPLARRHGMSKLWITTNPDNWPSRRTCERLGARLVDIVPIPKEHPFRSRGETAKCRYVLDLV
ncbi:MAG TPA: GNAT family N-acetyltransferase [Tepidisphaeraceae bacterium]|nr:GNAT family N-acetyltransferase [Tepidisphaeraceae bacterium]